MNKVTEQHVIGQIADRLSATYQSVPVETVRRLVGDVHARFDSRPVRDFVPLFVERYAKAELAKLSN